MAAIIQLPAHPDTRLAAPVAEFFALAQAVPEIAPEFAPQLRVIEGGRDASLRVRRSPAVYRRRRLAVTLLVSLLVLTSAAAVWRAVTSVPAATPVPTVSGDGAGALSAPTEIAPAANAATADVHVVQPGETLWSIAEEITGGGDIRVVVDRLADVAGSPTLQAGQRLDLSGVAGG